MIDLVNTSNTYVVYSNVVPDPPIDSIVKGVEVLQKEKPQYWSSLAEDLPLIQRKVLTISVKQFMASALKKFNCHTNQLAELDLKWHPLLLLQILKTGIKYPLADDSLLPDEAILTTFFVKSAPPKVTAYSGMDVLVHAMEALVAREANHLPMH